jgi:UDP-N-acetylmuramyl pentapeptide phosphotransferase/UDP-N-acetylglucosamine-1-phosphate transferase
LGRQETSGETARGGITGALEAAEVIGLKTWPPEPWEFAAAVGPFLAAGLTKVTLDRLHLRAKNFRGEEIPVGAGLFIALCAVPAYLAVAHWMPERHAESVAYAAVVGGMAALGFADDLFGDRSATGLKGHFKRILHGKITTGLIKAVGGLALGICVAGFILQRSWPVAVVDGTVIALSANALNLFDLRPGRAGAAFLSGAFALIALGWDYHTGFPLLLITVVPSFILYGWDMQGKVMMGDTGSNALGGALGLGMILAIPAVWGRLIVLALLIILHVVAERVSLTDVIERTPLLRKLDRLTGVR